MTRIIFIHFVLLNVIRRYFRFISLQFGYNYTCCAYFVNELLSHTINSRELLSVGIDSGSQSHSSLSKLAKFCDIARHTLAVGFMFHGRVKPGTIEKLCGIHDRPSQQNCMPIHYEVRQILVGY